MRVLFMRYQYTIRGYIRVNWGCHEFSYGIKTYLSLFRIIFFSFKSFFIGTSLLVCDFFNGFIMGHFYFSPITVTPLFHNTLSFESYDFSYAPSILKRKRCLGFYGRVCIEAIWRLHGFLLSQIFLTHK